MCKFLGFCGVFLTKPENIYKLDREKFHSNTWSITAFLSLVKFLCKAIENIIFKVVVEIII